MAHETNMLSGGEGENLRATDFDNVQARLPFSYRVS